jgi:hypothetical protein
MITPHRTEHGLCAQGIDGWRHDPIVDVERDAQPPQIDARVAQRHVDHCRILPIPGAHERQSQLQVST